jgi:hypothetical protein
MPTVRNAWAPVPGLIVGGGADGRVALHGDGDGEQYAGS